jgi:hypothetical protein
MKKMFLLLTAFISLSAMSQTTHVRANKFTSKDSTVTGTAATGFVASGKYRTWMYKPANLAQTAPALNIDLRSIAGQSVEYLRLSNPIPGSFPGTHFSFMNSPTLNADGTYNNVVSWGFNPHGAFQTDRMGIWYAIEPHWDDNGQLNIEVHLQMRLANGQTVRLFSYKINPGSNLSVSNTNQYQSGDAFSWQTMDSKQWASISTSKVGNTSNIGVYTPNTSQGFNITAQTTGVDFGPSGLTGASAHLRMNSFMKVQLPMALFAASDGGISYSGDQYGSAAYKSRDWGWVTGNNGNFKRVYASENLGAGLPNWQGTAILGAVVKDNTNPTGLLFQLQKDDFSTNIMTVRNDGKIYTALPVYSDDASAIADASLPVNTQYRVGNAVRIK